MAENPENYNISTVTHIQRVRIRPRWWRHPIIAFGWWRWDRKVAQMREDPVLAKAMDDHARDLDRAFLFGESDRG